MEKKYLSVIKAFCEQNSISYALIGGLALSAYGYTRFTNDVDFIAHSSAQEDIVSYLESIGFTTLQQDSSFSIHTLLHERLDFMYIDGETSDQIFQAVHTVSIMDVPLPVVSAMHLSMMKAFAGSQDATRLQDFNDIRELYIRKKISKSELQQITKKYNCRTYFQDFLEE